jgi:two-component system sensor histidine kinase UhpB
MTLFQRVLAINAGVLAAAAILLAVSPATVSPSLQLAEAVVLALGTVLMISVNLLLLRRVFGPLEELTVLMGRVDPMSPGRRLALGDADGEVAALCRAFNGMLDRLEYERQSSGRRALAAQENERRRIARELHDEIGQILTGVVLQLEALQRTADGEMQQPIAEIQESARDGVEHVREVARALRPQALDEFGLHSALVSLAAQMSDRTGVNVRPQIGKDVPALEPEEDLALYRVAQESLTNVARHAGARNVELVLHTVGATSVELVIRDDGVGITEQQAAGQSTGLSGMRERALLIGGHLLVAPLTTGGSEVRLKLPLAGNP